MKKIIIILLLLAPFVYAYYHKPLLDRHQEKLYATSKLENTTFDEAAASLSEWDGLEFVDWTVFTATRDKTAYSLVSFGLLDHVFVLDSDWAPKAFKLNRKLSS